VEQFVQKRFGRLSYPRATAQLVVGPRQLAPKHEPSSSNVRSIAIFSILPNLFLHLWKTLERDPAQPIPFGQW
jgi:hypothetical protein